MPKQSGAESPHSKIYLAPAPQLPPTPMIHDRIPKPLEYRVIQANAKEAAALQAELNAYANEGWWLVGIVPLEGKLILVMGRSPDREK